MTDQQYIFSELRNYWTQKISWSSQLFLKQMWLKSMLMWIFVFCIYILFCSWWRIFIKFFINLSYSFLCISCSSLFIAVRFFIFEILETYTFCSNFKIMFLIKHNYNHENEFFRRFEASFFKIIFAVASASSWCLFLKSSDWSELTLCLSLKFLTANNTT